MSRVSGGKLSGGLLISSSVALFAGAVLYAIFNDMDYGLSVAVATVLILTLVLYIIVLPAKKISNHRRKSRVVSKPKVVLELPREEDDTNFEEQEELPETIEEQALEDTRGLDEPNMLKEVDEPESVDEIFEDDIPEEEIAAELAKKPKASSPKKKTPPKKKSVPKKITVKPKK